MARKQFEAVEKTIGYDPLIEVFDYGDKSVIVVPREVADKIDPLKRGALSDKDAPSYFDIMRAAREAAKSGAAQGVSGGSDLNKKARYFPKKD